MSARRTGLAFSAFSLDTVDLLAVLTSAQVSIDGVILNGAGIAEQFEKGIWAGGKGTVTCKIEHTTSSVPSTNLNVTAFSLGGSSYLGDLRTGTIRQTNPSAEGKGLADKWSFPNAVGGRKYELSGTLLVPSATALHALMTAAGSETIGDHTIATTMTIGSDTFACSCAIQNATHTGERGGLQEVSISLTGAATPGTVGSGLYGVAITGDALLSLVLDTEAGQYGTSGTPLTCFVSSMEISFADGQIVETSLTLEVQGRPTPTTST